jgi:hypothetical protein
MSLRAACSPKPRQGVAKDESEAIRVYAIRRKTVSKNWGNTPLRLDSRIKTLARLLLNCSTALLLYFSNALLLYLVVFFSAPEF